MDKARNENGSRESGANEQKPGTGETKARSDEASAGGDAPEVGDVELAVLHLMLVTLDIHQVMTLAQFAPSVEFIKEAVVRYWRAFTRGWGRKRHARVYLLECIHQVEILRVVAPIVAAKGREKLSGATVPPFFEQLFQLLTVAPFRESFESAVQQKEFSDADVIRAFYSQAYPIEARRLSDEQVNYAIKELRRMGGHRPGAKKPRKWAFFCELFKAIGIGPVKPTALAQDWDDWRHLRGLASLRRAPRKRATSRSRASK